MQQKESTRLVLTRAIGDRILVGVVSVVFGLFLSLVCFVVHEFQPVTSTERVFKVAAFEAFFTITSFCLLGLTWALFAPRWLERLMQGAHQKVLLAVGILGGATLATIIYFIFVS